MSASIFSGILMLSLCWRVLSDEFPYPKDAPSSVDQCRDVIFNCDCGNPGHKFQAQFKQCHFWMPPEQACVRFQHCLDCEDGVDRCVACPIGRYGRWCNGACRCKNGGTCNKQDGSCFCPAGYGGDFCEVRKTLLVGETNCNTKGNAVLKKEANILINVTCPSGCQEAGGGVWGTSIYSEESSICRAAIHAGVLTNEGGIVSVVDNGVYSNYIGTDTSISSRGSSKRVRSFRFEIFKPNENDMTKVDRKKCPEKWQSIGNSICVISVPIQIAWGMNKEC